MPAHTLTNIILTALAAVAAGYPALWWWVLRDPHLRTQVQWVKIKTRIGEAAV
jgi:hypothetical protein